MKKVFLMAIAITGLLVACNNQQESADSKIPLAPEKYRKPQGYDPSQHRYKYSLSELSELYAEEMMSSAARQYQKVMEVNDKGKWKPAAESMDAHKAPEWYGDAKFGMYIDWGLWSVAGWAPKKEKGAMYPDWYEFRLDTDSAFMEYHEKNWGKDFMRDDFIPLFQAKDYRPEQLVKIAREAGMKYIVPFCKHHSGFCLWPSSYTHRDVYDMTGKDLLKPLVESCRENGMKFGYYVSIEEWEYPVIDDSGEMKNREWGGEVVPYSRDMERKSSGKIAVKDYAKDYLLPQITEFIDTYDPDILWYDGDWSTPANDLLCYDISAYYYNQAEGRKEVAVNDRYGTAGRKWLRSVRGDFFTDEFGDMEKEVKQANHSWEENRGISQSYGFNWQDTDANVISSKGFIDMFVDIVAHGGNLLLIVNLDAQGALPDVQENRLRDIGKWLKVNGEGIYSTRAYSVSAEDNVRYTRSKDSKTVFAISLNWPGTQLQLKSVEPAKDSKIHLLGYGEPLEWTYQNGTTAITLPSKLQKASNRPCDHAWVFKIEGQTE
jgi:alpha-L-fucosidase